MNEFMSWVELKWIVLILFTLSKSRSYYEYNLFTQYLKCVLKADYWSINDIVWVKLNGLT